MSTINNDEPTSKKSDSVLPGKRGVRASIEMIKVMLEWSKDTSDEERRESLVGSDWFKDVVKDYVVSAAKNAGFTNEPLENLLDGLKITLNFT